MSKITELLEASRSGDEQVMRELFDLLYQDLRQLAHARLRRSGEFTLLDTTALVHESYLRLFDSGEVAAKNKGHFMAYAAKVMRSIVVDFVRKRATDRRGGDVVHINIEHADALASDPREQEVLNVHEALEELAVIDVELVRVVEMRYFAGMSEPEVAEALDRSVRSVARDWQKARVFLASTLSQPA
jgi:RNA polymerase sigma factor (TIGR02999 family)